MFSIDLVCSRWFNENGSHICVEGCLMMLFVCLILDSGCIEFSIAWLGWSYAVVHEPCMRAQNLSPWVCLFCRLCYDCMNIPLSLPLLFAWCCYDDYMMRMHMPCCCSWNPGLFQKSCLYVCTSLADVVACDYVIDFHGHAIASCCLICWWIWCMPWLHKP